MIHSSDVTESSEDLGEVVDKNNTDRTDYLKQKMNLKLNKMTL